METKQYATREIGHSELSEKLYWLNRFGVEVPTLSSSINTPKYIRTTKDGVEIYNLGEETLKVHPNEVIDSHGNVVNIGELERQLARIKIK